MATTTTNNGWTIPQSTDLVKNGATAIATLGNGIDTSTGKGLIAWQSWAPTLSGGWANGNGTWTAYYCQIGKTVHCYGEFTVGSSTTKGTTLTCSLPTTARFNYNQTWLATCVVAGTTIFKGTWRMASTSTVTFTSLFVSGTLIGEAGITSNAPGIWATGDKIRIQMTYETA